MIGQLCSWIKESMSKLFLKTLTIMTLSYLYQLPCLSDVATQVVWAFIFPRKMHQTSLMLKAFGRKIITVIFANNCDYFYFYATQILK